MYHWSLVYFRSVVEAKFLVLFCEKGNIVPAVFLEEGWEVDY